MGTRIPDNIPSARASEAGQNEGDAKAPRRGKGRPGHGLSSAAMTTRIPQSQSGRSSLHPSRGVQCALSQPFSSNPSGRACAQRCAGARVC